MRFQNFTIREKEVGLPLLKYINNFRNIKMIDNLILYLYDFRYFSRKWVFIELPLSHTWEDMGEISKICYDCREIKYQEKTVLALNVSIDEMISSHPFELYPHKTYFYSSYFRQYISLNGNEEIWKFLLRETISRFLYASVRIPDTHTFDGRESRKGWMWLKGGESEWKRFLDFQQIA